MLIVSADRVDYCPIVKKEGDPSKVFRGVRYQDKLYTHTQHFSKEEKQNAIERAKALVLENKGRLLVLVIEIHDGYEIWTQNPHVAIQEAQEISIKDFDLEEIVRKMLEEDGLAIKDRQYKWKNYPRCFIGSEAVTWLQASFDLSQERALQLGQRLMDEKWIHHVTDEHPFKDEYLFYRVDQLRGFRNIPIADLALEEIVGAMLKIDGLAIKDRQYKWKNYPRCFIGSEAMTWLQENLGLSQEEALQLGQRLIDEKWIHHVTDEHSFRDEYLFYRFYLHE